MTNLLDWRVAIGFALGQLPWLFAFAAAAFVKRGGSVTWEESRGLEPDYGRHTLAPRDVELDDTQPNRRVGRWS